MNVTQLSYIKKIQIQYSSMGPTSHSTIIYIIKHRNQHTNITPLLCLYVAFLLPGNLKIYINKMYVYEEVFHSFKFFKCLFLCCLYISEQLFSKNLAKKRMTNLESHLAYQMLHYISRLLNSGQTRRKRNQVSTALEINDTDFFSSSRFKIHSPGTTQSCQKQNVRKTRRFWNSKQAPCKPFYIENKQLRTSLEGSPLYCFWRAVFSS